MSQPVEPTNGDPKSGSPARPAAVATAAAPSSATDVTTTPKQPKGPQSVIQRLFTQGHAFEFFQAVRLLQSIDSDSQPLGYDGSPASEPARLRSYLSLAFPAGQIFEIEAPTAQRPQAGVTVTFFGLTGVNGALPRYYTELLLRLERDAKHPEKRAAREWFDVFNHRLLSLFYRSWSKYRFYLQFERHEHQNKEPDAFTQALLALTGIGTWPLRNRMTVRPPQTDPAAEPAESLAELPDLAVLHYAGFFAQRPRTAYGLEATLADYFKVPVQVKQFQGEWLPISPSDQTRLGMNNSSLGGDMVMGQRVWDVEGKIRIRLGPLDLAQFSQFLPDETPNRQYKGFFVLSHLVRLYIGASLEFDLQLLLRADCIPKCQLGATDSPGARLGWNTWLRSKKAGQPADDAVFAGREVFYLNSRL